MELTTIRDAKNSARFTEVKELKEFLNKNSLIVKSIEKIAYTAGVYGCNGYLLRIETTTGLPIYAFTGRSSWMYNCDCLSLYNDSNEFQTMTKKQTKQTISGFVDWKTNKKTQ